MMALVEAARKVRATIARPCAQGQMGSQCDQHLAVGPLYFATYLYRVRVSTRASCFKPLLTSQNARALL